MELMLVCIILAANTVFFSIIAPLFNLTATELYDRVEHVYLIIGIAYRFKLYLMERKLSKQEVNYHG